MVVDIQPLQSHESDSIVNFLQIPTNDYTYFSNTYLSQKKRIWKIVSTLLICMHLFLQLSRLVQRQYRYTSMEKGI